MSTLATATRTRRSRAVAAVGWLLVATGAVILLYLAYLLWFTGLETDREQLQLLETWQVERGDPRAATRATDDPTVGDAAPASDVRVGDAYAALWFERPGAAERPVTGEVLYVVEGVTTEALKRGPGHYPQTGPPGGPGNVAIAGHRTTYGAPFYDLDQLQSGDEIHLVDRQNRSWVYVFEDIRITAPDAVWVLGDDPLGNGRPTLTLTTCHPRFSARQRLIVFAQLRGG